MNIRRMFLVAQFFFFVLALYCCGRPSELSRTSESEDAQYTRQHIGTVVFNRWPDDYILLTSVLKRTGDTCQFVSPVQKDPSLYVGPLQSVWVIHDKEKTSDSKVISDVFYKGDRLTLEDLPEDGATPLSFRNLSAFHKKSLKVEQVESSKSGQELKLKLTVDTSVVKTSASEIGETDVILTNGTLVANIVASPILSEGVCKTETKYCIEGETCNQNGDEYGSFSSLNVNLTSSFIPKIDSVVIN